MNKVELANKVAEVAGLKKGETLTIVETVFDQVAKALVEGDAVKIAGFGGFEVRDTAERKARNIQTGEEIFVPASKKPAFKPSKALKDQIKQS